MSAPNYDQYLVNAVPMWLRGTTGAALGDGEFFFQQLGAFLNWQAQRRKDAVFCRLPSYAPTEDAMKYLGDERQLGRGPTEPEASYRQRLVNAWTAWLSAGTPLGVLSALYFAGYTSVAIAQRGWWYTTTAGTTLNGTALTQPSYQIAGVPLTYWSGFDIYFTAYPSWWGGVVPAQTSPEGQFIQRVCLLWKPAFALLGRIIFTTGGWFLGTPAAGILGSTTPVLATATIGATWTINQ